MCEPDVSVGIDTRLRAGRPRSRDSIPGKRFFSSLRFTQAPIQWVPVTVFLGG
jgi:hypothetical protein